jgi:hypothetical protein
MTKLLVSHAAAIHMFQHFANDARTLTRLIRQEMRQTLQTCTPDPSPDDTDHRTHEPTFMEDPEIGGFGHLIANLRLLCLFTTFACIPANQIRVSLNEE